MCLGLLRYQQITNYRVINKACADTITVNGKDEGIAICYINRLTTFEIKKEGAAKVVWNFGDGTAKVEGSPVSHKFTKAGNYRVVASVNGNCKLEGEVTVRHPRNLDLNKQEKIEVRIFQDPVNPKVGSTVTLVGVPNIPIQVNSYEWKLLNGRNVKIKKDSAANFKFNSPGKYTVQLMINNDPLLTTKKVIEVVAVPPPMLEAPIAGSNVGGPGAFAPPPVLPGESPSNNQNDQQQNQSNQRPIDSNQATQPGINQRDKTALDSPKAAVKSGAIIIDEDSFKDLLQEVIEEDKEIDELYEYLDLKGETKVEVNGGEVVKLPKFCRNARSKKNKIESLKFSKNENNSIQLIKVKLQKRKGLFKRVFSK
jgi:PKD repeat protein